MTTKTPPLFDRETTPAGGRTLSHIFDAGERADIRDRLGVIDVTALSGSGRVIHHDKGLMLNALLSAALVRACVASLEPMDEIIEEDFSIRFVPARDFARLVGEEDAPGTHQADDLDAAAEFIDPEAVDIEPLGPQPIDFREILIQQAALAMAPYPRRDDAQLDPAAMGDNARISPFAALRDQLKNPDDD